MFYDNMNQLILAIPNPTFKHMNQVANEINARGELRRARAMEVLTPSEQCEPGTEKKIIAGVFLVSTRENLDWAKDLDPPQARILVAIRTSEKLITFRRVFADLPLPDEKVREVGKIEGDAYTLFLGAVTSITEPNQIVAIVGMAHPRSLIGIQARALAERACCFGSLTPQRLDS